MIRVSTLTKRYGKTIGVEGLDFEIPDSKIFALLGPNGSGKTTTLRLMSGLIAPTKGTVYIDDLDVTKRENLANIHREIGILPETPGHYEGLSAYRNLEFYGRMYKMNDDTARDRITELLKDFDLWKQRLDPVATFSKGMKQKLAIIRAIMHDPKYVFLDEPVSGLDPEAAHFVREFMKKLRSDGKTVILSTHDLDDADRLSDTVAVIRNKLLVADNPRSLKQKMFKRTVVFHLKSSENVDIKEIESLSFVRDASVKDGRLVLNLDSPEDNDPEIVELLVKRGVKIQFIGEIRHSLEDVYLTIVEQSEEGK